jgi:malate dehydrogenase (oxaloacetate-decarboxylating)(NADP+)
MVNQDRNVFAACMVATGDADAMVTGLTRSTADCLANVSLAIGPQPGGISFGLTLLLGMRGKAIFIADSMVNFRPDAEELANIAIGAAAAARRFGHEPRHDLGHRKRHGERNRHPQNVDPLRRTGD